MENGSGKGLNITAFKVGGKTGTAQIAKNGDYKKGGTTYQGSFVGYFPADNPLYTCIVIINSPANGTYYGGLVAGPVFKEIAEKVYSSSVDFIKPVNNQSDLLTAMPEMINTRKEELTSLAKNFGVSVSDNLAQKTSNLESQLKKGIMPNLSGLSAKDVLFLLENNGLHVTLQGFGTVKKQSIEAGQAFTKGTKITLTLNANNTKQLAMNDK